MWPFERKSVRRKEIRRSKAERGLTWYRGLARLKVVPIGAMLLTALLAAIAVNLGGSTLDVRVDETVPRAITSRVEFRVANEARTIEMRVRARDNAENYYELDESLVQEIRGRLTNAMQLAKEHANDPAALRQTARQAKILLDEEGAAELARIATLTDADELQRTVDRFQTAIDHAVERLVQQPPLLAEAIDSAQRRTAVNAILIDPRPEAQRSGPPEREVAVAKLLPSNQAEAAETVAEQAAQAFRKPLRESMRASLVMMLRGENEGQVKPIYRYSAARSNAAAQQAYEAVPKQFDVYRRGQQLADAGRISEEEQRLLRQEHDAFARWMEELGGSLTAGERAQLAQASPAVQEQIIEERAAARDARERAWLRRLGYAFFALLVPLGLVMYLAQTQRPRREQPIQRIALPIALLLVIAVARLLYIGTATPFHAVGIQAFAVALLAVVNARAPVFAITGGLALLLTIATRQGVGFFLVLLTVSATLLFGLQDIRNRGKIVAVGVTAGLLALATTLAAGLIGGQTLGFAFRQQALLAAATTVAAAFLVEGILPGIERVFKVSTSMTLLEWCDASKAVLRMLAAEAPGTYNHSLMVGTLAEAAAEAIGARGLLARTGSYYHDIGKINKPEYFAENQGFGASRHDRLSPAMSHLIIIGHVKDGIEMAKEYGLPPSLIPFIAEHHGTTLVEYFYHAASQQRKPGDREVSDVQFRYPGPKPQSRETATVMLCDSVEGAVRAMPEPTPNRIEDTVSKIVQRRLVDGQFDECDLTFRELEVIERTLVKSLCAIYHSRIVYPEREDSKKTDVRAS